MEQADIQKLRSYVDALRPVIYIKHFDFHAVDELLKDVSNGIDIHEYNEAGHYVDFDNKTAMGIMHDHDNLPGFLSAFDTNDPRNVFVVLKDIHHYFKYGDPRYSPEIIARIKSIAQRTMFRDDVYITVFLVCSELVIPAELEKMITVFDIPLPDNKEIEAIIKNYEQDFQIPKIEDAVLNELIVSFKGLSDFEIRQILNFAYQQSGTIGAKDKKLILEEKEQIIRKSGILEILPINSRMNDVGGLVNLKKYLQDKSLIFNNLGEARKFGIDLPKGILIVGMPGCGKSLTAKSGRRLPII